MSFSAGKISNFMPIESLEDLLSRNINNYFSAVDRDLQNLFQMASLSVQFDGIGNQYEIPQSNGDGTYDWTPSLGGWNISGGLLWSGVTASYIALEPGTGIWMGDEAFLSAPFSVDSAGVLHAHSGIISGWTLSTTKMYSGTDLNYDYIALTPNVGIHMGREEFADAPFSVTKEGVLKAVSGTIGGWTLASTGFSGGSGANYIGMKFGTGIWMGAETFGAAAFSVDNNGNMKSTLSVITAPLIQTNANPGTNRVLIDSSGLRGYDDTLGLTFNIKTDGNPPTFANGIIQFATIIDTTIISNDFKTSSELPWIEFSDSGAAYRETQSVAQYGSGAEYGDGTLYGVGVQAYYGNSNRPILSVEAERTFADIRLYNRSSEPSGAAIVGDLCVDSGELKMCTTLGTPGTYKTFAFTDALDSYLLNTDDSFSGTLTLNDVSNATLLDIDNDGTGHGLYLHQDGAVAAGKFGLYVYSNAVNITNGALARLHMANSSASSSLCEIMNSGTGNALYVGQDTTNAGSKHGISLYSNAVISGGDSALAKFMLDNSSSSEPVLETVQDGTGDCIEIDANGTGHGLYVHQDGNLATGKYSLYIDNNGTPTDGAGRAIRLDGCTISSTKSPETDAEAGFIAINVDGTQYAVPYYALS